MATLLPVQAGGVSRDYASIVADLRKLIPSITPEWTYTGEDDVGVALLELTAYLADNLHYHADAVLRDTSIATTVYRWMAVEKAEWLGYLPTRAAPARATVTFAIAAAHTSDIPIPKATQVTAVANGETVYFETEDASTLIAGTTSVDVDVVEGRTSAEYNLGTATGDEFETFEVPDADAIFSNADGDFEVFVGADEATFVQWPVEATSEDLAYWVRELRTGRLELRFGDGNYGSRLSAGLAVTCTYRYGGGRVGNVASGAISTLVASLSDLLGAPVTVTVANVGDSSGGAPQETLEEIRISAPASFRSQQRLVTLEDYRVFTQAIPGIYRAQPVRRGLNGVLIYVVEDDVTAGSTLSPAIVSYWTDLVDAQRMSSDVVAFENATLVGINARIVIHALSGYRVAEVRNRVRELFTGTDGILAVSNNELGQHLRLSDMVGAVEDIEGLDYVDTYTYTRQPSLKWSTASGNADLAANSVVITNDTTEQTWYVNMLTATTYSVRGSTSGVQGTVGTLGVQFVTDTGAVSWTIDAGTLPMLQGDRGYIKVGKLLWNIQLAAGEFPVVGDIVIL